MTPQKPEPLRPQYIKGGCVITIVILLSILLVGKVVLAEEEAPKLLYFHAAWCGQCKATASILHQIEHTKIDVDEERGKSRDYKITHVPTLLIVLRGKEIARKTGTCGIDEIKQWFNAIIQKEKK